MRFANGSAAVFATTIALATATAHAQGTGNDKVTAEALFEDARKLVADKKYADACPKFADSERLDPSAATLLNLASCWEKAGRTATAWATYKEAASSANAAGRKDYVTAAERHADALAPTLARLTINVAAPIDGIQIRRDGVSVDRAEWATAIPIDPGTHALNASAPGHNEWSAVVEVPQNGAQVIATVPPLEAAPVEMAATTAAAPQEAAAGPAAPTAGVGAAPAAPSAPNPAGSGSAQRIAGWVVSAIGVAGVAIGAGFLVDAKNKYSDSLDNGCQPAPNQNSCLQPGFGERSDARSAGDIATVAFVVGGAAIAGGVALWLTAPSGPKNRETGKATTLVLMPTLGGAALQGAW
jgi:hypothetical protein